MNFIFKLLLAFNATSWMGIIYVIKNGWTFWKIPGWFFGLLLIAISIALSALSLLITKKFKKDTLGGCKELSLVDGDFLPIYLGYFFVSISVSEHLTMLFVFVIVFIFTLVSQTQYFNPIFLLFGYHYYNILTESGTRIFLIKKGAVARKVSELSTDTLYRINDTTFIELTGRKKKNG